MTEKENQILARDRRCRRSYKTIKNYWFMDRKHIKYVEKYLMQGNSILKAHADFIIRVIGDIAFLMGMIDRMNGSGDIGKWLAQKPTKMDWAKLFRHLLEQELRTSKKIKMKRPWKKIKLNSSNLT